MHGVGELVEIGEGRVRVRRQNRQVEKKGATNAAAKPRSPRHDWQALETDD
jgi:hypothetical protein